MELKPISSRSTMQPNCPTFNRTTMELKLFDLRRAIQLSLAFNRTTMELKRSFAWCCFAWFFAFNRTTMELKLYILSAITGQWYPFNRTTMELKLTMGYFRRILQMLLIEPLWNWNNEEKTSGNSSPSTFNRTTMELKRDNHLGLVRFGTTF